MEIVIVGLVLVLLIGGTFAAWSYRQRDVAELREMDTVQQRASSALASSGSEVVLTTDERRSPSTREQRESWIHEREEQGLCRYCEERAIKQYPCFEPIRPMLDWVFRYFNATPNNRWTIKLERGTEAPLSLCTKHHEWQFGYFEELIAHERAKNSKFAADQRLLMYEFERFGSDERALEEMQTIRRGNRKRPAPARQDSGANVIRLKRAADGSGS